MGLVSHLTTSECRPRDKVSTCGWTDSEPMTLLTAMSFRWKQGACEGTWLDTASEHSHIAFGHSNFLGARLNHTALLVACPYLTNKFF